MIGEGPISTGDRVALVACCKAKRPDAALPARDLYIGQLFRNAAAYCDVAYPGRWWILSARHGLLAPDDVIRPYDATLLTMTPLERTTWNEKVAAQLRAKFPLGTFFDVFAGNLYADCLAGFPHYRPLKSMGIGQQMAALKCRYELACEHQQKGDVCE